jgi:hypothetical protein
MTTALIIILVITSISLFLVALMDSNNIKETSYKYDYLIENYFVILSHIKMSNKDQLHSCENMINNFKRSYPKTTNSRVKFIHNLFIYNLEDALAKELFLNENSFILVEKTKIDKEDYSKFIKYDDNYYLIPYKIFKNERDKRI